MCTNRKLRFFGKVTSPTDTWFYFLRIIMFKRIHLTLNSWYYENHFIFVEFTLNTCTHIHSKIFVGGDTDTRSDPFLNCITVHYIFSIHSCFFRRYSLFLIKFIEIQHHQSKQSYHKTCYKGVQQTVCIDHRSFSFSRRHWLF